MIYVAYFLLGFVTGAFLTTIALLVLLISYERTFPVDRVQRLEK